MSWILFLSWFRLKSFVKGDLRFSFGFGTGDVISSTRAADGGCEVCLSNWRSVMTRLQQITNEQANEKTRKLFDGVNQKLGTVPNMMRAMGNSSAVLSSYLQFSGELAKGSLSGKQRELIALAVGQTNECDYCLAAHSALGKMAGLSVEQISDARSGQSVDSTDDALVRLAVKLVKQQGHLADADIEDARNHGFDDAAIAEVVANVALNIFTNYFNHVTETEIDFPPAPKLSVA